MSEIVEVLERLRRDAKSRSDAAYCNVVHRAMRITETMGEDAKLSSGSFGKAELEAHRISAESMGAHKAYAAMGTLIDVALEEAMRGAGTR